MKLLPMFFTLYLCLTNRAQAISVNPEQAIKTVEGNIQVIILAASGIAFMGVAGHYLFKDGKEGEQKFKNAMIGIFLTVTAVGIYPYFFR